MTGLGAGGVQIVADLGVLQEQVLTPGALDFLTRLQRRLGPGREAILRARTSRQEKFDAGLLPGFPKATQGIRDDPDWSVAPPPPDLLDRRVEITGPVDRKMMINALNSGARTYMADFEDAHSPTWQNCIEGQANLAAAVRGSIALDVGPRSYRLNPKIATLLVRPRGWHLLEKHLLVDGAPMSASWFDFGLFIFHNARRLLDRGSGPYLYLPKLEGHLEARLWNDTCRLAEAELDLPPGSIRATVLIENILAAFEMEEILFELRERAVGLNAGRWDYIFSVIRKFRNRPEFVLPDRAMVTMTVPFMRAYTDLLVSTCHRRGTHALGGMAAFIPNRHDPGNTQIALDRVRQDKQREVDQGFDGTWVAHPDLVPTATAVFDSVLGSRPNQVGRRRDDVRVAASDLLAIAATPGEVTEAGLRLNISTAEISRSQVWQWLRHGRVNKAQVLRAENEILARLGPGYEGARQVFDEVALGPEFVDFLTVPAYRLLP
jgi:malate synthase